jgi:hypothetical protein
MTQSTEPSLSRTCLLLPVDSVVLQPSRKFFIRSATPTPSLVGQASITARSRSDRLYLIHTHLSYFDTLLIRICLCICAGLARFELLLLLTIATVSSLDTAYLLYISCFDLPFSFLLCVMPL